MYTYRIVLNVSTQTAISGSMKCLHKSYKLPEALGNLLGSPRGPQGSSQGGGAGGGASNAPVLEEDQEDDLYN